MTYSLQTKIISVRSNVKAGAPSPRKSIEIRGKEEGKKRKEGREEEGGEKLFSPPPPRSPTLQSCLRY